MMVFDFLGRYVQAATQVWLVAPWQDSSRPQLKPFTVGYFKGRTRVFTLMAILAVSHDAGLDIEKALSH